MPSAEQPPDVVMTNVGCGKSWPDLDLLIMSDSARFLAYNPQEANSKPPPDLTLLQKGGRQEKFPIVWRAGKVTKVVSTVCKSGLL